MRQFLLSETVFKRLTTRYNGSLECQFCGESLTPNQKIIVTAAKGRVKHYHKECYLKTLH
jgi:hypothetical protein